MLTATYSLVAITNEQSNIKNILCKLQQGVLHVLNNLRQADVPLLKSLLNKLAQFDKYCRNRKVEAHLIPAIRQATAEAEPLLNELDALSTSGMRILESVRGQLFGMTADIKDSATQICASMHLYCEMLSTRLTREEQQLFPMVERLFSTEEWFSIAAKFLSEDAAGRGRMPHARCIPPLSGSSMASWMRAL